MRPVLVAVLGVLLATGMSEAGSVRGYLQTDDLPVHLRDRGDGVPTSMFGTYIQKGQLLVYPFVEHYRNADQEYKPSELGHTVDTDYRGDYEAFEQLLFVAYGLTDRLALEMEGAVIQAELEKSPQDRSSLPQELAERGVGDIEGQLRWSWSRESSRTPGFFSYFETVTPTQKEGSLIGTSAWEYKLGTGMVRGFRWGTMTVRAAMEYDGGEKKFDVGELAVEYLKRLSNSWRIYAGAEGTQDEWEFITEAQWMLAPTIMLKFNNAFGVTSKANDWAPELGVMFGF